MDILVQYLIVDDLKRCFNTFGIEGTEVVIERNFNNNDEIKKAYKEVYIQLVKGNI